VSSEETAYLIQHYLSNFAFIQDISFVLKNDCDEFDYESELSSWKRLIEDERRDRIEEIAFFTI